MYRALLKAQEQLQAQQEWTITTGTGTSCNHITINNSWTSASSTDWQLNPEMWRFVQSVATYNHQAVPRKSLAPAIINHRGDRARSSERGGMFSSISQQEILALQLLRKMVEPDAFRKYLRHGFVPIRAASGLVYQIDRINRIKVWEMGEHIATLCVHLRGHCPPTDEVVGKILIVEYNEADIWKRSNITWETSNRNRKSLEIIGQASHAGPRIEQQINISGGENLIIAATG